MKITILCVGKIKEKFYRDAIAEYSKRLSRYCKLDIIEVADEKTPENASDTVENQIREKEAERILMRLDKEAKESSLCETISVVSLTSNISKRNLTLLVKHSNQLIVNKIQTFLPPSRSVPIPSSKKYHTK